MKKLYLPLIMVSMLLLIVLRAQGQDTVRINFTLMTPHIGQSVYLRVVDVSNNTEVGRTSIVVTSPDFSLAVGGIMPDSSYNLDFYADFNQNGRYDTPPADHAWRITMDSVQGDTAVTFVHNTNFTDIGWVSRITLALSNMNPHMGQNLYFALKNKSDGSELDRKMVTEDSVAFDVVFDSVMTDSSYIIDFFADHNNNGRYDVPPADHAWRITLDSIKGDTVVPFVHNTNFTDIGWKNSGYRITLALSNMTPHMGQNLYFALKNKSNGWELERKMVTEDTVNFDVVFDSVMVDSSYIIDFFADHNSNGRYDPPDADHAWRITLDSIKGDTLVPFVHNTNFTDIEWMNKLTVNFTDMTPHLNQVLYLYLRDIASGEFIDSVKVDPVMQAAFSVSLFTIKPDSSYSIDFYADFNENGMYDAPPEDHAWRILLLDVQGDTTVNFVHNTDFTDIFGEPVTGIDDLQAKGFSIYPNPVKDELTVRAKHTDATISALRIYNASGTLVLQKADLGTNQEVRVNVTSLKPGMYILNVSDGRNTLQLKFIKE